MGSAWICNCHILDLALVPKEVVLERNTEKIRKEIRPTE